MRHALPTLVFATTLVTGCSSSSGGAGPGWPGDGGAADGPSSQGDGATADSSVEDAAANDAASEASASVDSGVVVEAGPGEAGTMQTVEMTFYGWDDNSPPGGSIAYPKNGGFPTVHDTAGGTGTYADPITYATDKSELPIGTIVYAPVIEKYLVMEDDCGQCDTDWSGSMMWHIDVWMNSNGTESSNDLFNCEDTWTRSATEVVTSPSPNLPVTTAPLFDPATNTCRTTP